MVDMNNLGLFDLIDLIRSSRIYLNNMKTDKGEGDLLSNNWTWNTKQRFAYGWNEKLVSLHKDKIFGGNESINIEHLSSGDLVTKLRLRRVVEYLREKGLILP